MDAGSNGQLEAYDERVFKVFMVKYFRHRFWSRIPFPCWSTKINELESSQDIYDNSSINKSHDNEYGRWEGFFDGAHSYEPTLPSSKRMGYERTILGPLHNEDHFHHPVMHVPLHDDDADREYIPLSKGRPLNIHRLNIMSFKPVDIDIRPKAIQVVTPFSRTLDGVKAFLSDVTSFTRAFFLMSSQHTLGLLLSLWALLNILFRCVRYVCVRYFTLSDQSSVIQGSFSPLFSDPALFPVPIIDSPKTSPPFTPEITPGIISSPSPSQSDVEDEIAVEISLFGYDSDYNPYPAYYTSQSTNGNVAIEPGFFTNRLDADHSYLLPVIPPHDSSNPNPVDSQGNLPLLPFDPNKDGRCLTRPKYSKRTWIPPWPRFVAQVHTPALALALTTSTSASASTTTSISASVSASISASISASTSTSTSASLTTSASTLASTSASAFTTALASAPTSIKPPSGSSVQFVSPLPKPSREKETKQKRPSVFQFPFIDVGNLGRSSDFSRSANPWLRLGHDISNDNDNDEFVMGSSRSRLGLTLDAESDSDY